MIPMNGFPALNRNASSSSRVASSASPSSSPFLNGTIVHPLLSSPSSTIRKLPDSAAQCSEKSAADCASSTLAGLVQKKLVIGDAGMKLDHDDHHPQQQRREGLPPTNLGNSTSSSSRQSSVLSSPPPPPSPAAVEDTVHTSSSSILQVLRRKRGSLHNGRQPASSFVSATISAATTTLPSCRMGQSLQRMTTATTKACERAARNEMIQLLETRLRIKCRQTISTSSSSFSNGHHDDPEQVPKTARILEQLLFKQSNQNLKTYQDKSTLDGRLRSIMTVLVRRKMILNTNNDPNHCNNGNNGNNHNRKHQRSIMLQRLLGRERYAEIRNLVRQIQMTKMKKVASLKCGMSSSSSLSSSCSTSSMSTSSSSSSNNCCGKTFGENLPSVIRRLYFETTLLSAFETYDLKRIQREVRSWDMLVEQAEENLRDFQEWEQQEQLQQQQQEEAAPCVGMRMVTTDDIIYEEGYR